MKEKLNFPILNVWGLVFQCLEKPENTKIDITGKISK